MILQAGFSIVGTVVKTAAFGAIAGKLFDSFVLSKINNNTDQRRWLRQTKLETYSCFCDKILNAHIGKLSNDDFGQLRANATKSILLIDDKKLITTINSYLYSLNLQYSTDENIKRNETSKINKQGLEIINLLNKNLKS